MTNGKQLMKENVNKMYHAMIWNGVIIDEDNRVREKDGMYSESRGFRDSLREKVIKRETDPTGEAVCDNCGDKKRDGIFFVWNDDVGLIWKVRKKVGIIYHCKECLMEDKKHEDERWQEVVDEGITMQ
jgi:ribosomal protein L44E